MGTSDDKKKKPDGLEAAGGEALVRGKDAEIVGVSSVYRRYRRVVFAKPSPNRKVRTIH